MKCKISGMGSFICCLLFSLFVQGQAKQFSDAKNFFEYQQKVNAYYDQVGKTTSGYKQWKRLEWYFSTRLSNDGSMLDYQQLKQDALLKTAAMKTSIGGQTLGTESLSGAWTPVGPTSVNSREKGIGRVNRLAFIPTNESTIFAATAGGGLWKTTNGGSSWFPLTDGLPNLTLSDVAVNPNNPNIIYILTGDADGGGSSGGGKGGCCSFGKYSTGVLKSLDGGITWNYTGLKWAETDGRLGFKLIMHPTNPNILLMGASDGIYRTEDAGNSWIKLLPLPDEQNFYDIEFKPDDPLVVYAISKKGRFFRSNDGGIIWNLKYASTHPDASRGSIAVTADNPNSVYMLLANSGNIKTDPSFYAFNGLYYTGDMGEQWFERASKLPNVFSGDGTDLDGRQETFDHALAASPFDVADVFTGGVSLFRSSNGGTTLNLVVASSAIYHADIHELTYGPSGVALYAATDGGIYKSIDNGITWIFISGNMAITQYYRISTAPISSIYVLGGAQDNGTHLRNSSSSIFEAPPATGGDGMDNAISTTNPSIMYASKQDGTLYFSSNSGNSFGDFCSPSILESFNIKVGGPWLTNIKIHPTQPTTVYMGYTSVIRGILIGSFWAFFDIGSKALDTISGEHILEVAPSDPNIIYAGKFDYKGAQWRRLWRTSNGGTTWDTIILPHQQQRFSKLAINPTDPDEIWLTYGGFDSRNKVFYSRDAGKNWTNITGSLPNVPVNCILYANNYEITGDALYIGTDIGVFYRDNTLGDWIPFSNGLPVVEVTDLEINTIAGLLRAGTYGRGVWQTSLFIPSCTANLIFNTSDHPPSTPGFHTAGNSISSTATITGAGAHIEYKAGQSITLTPQFRINATTGARFVAYIGPCPGGGVPPGYTAPTMNGLSGYLIENK